MRSHLFVFPCVFSLGFLAGYQWAWLSEITLDGLLSSSPKETIPLNLVNMMQAARLAMGALQEAVVLLLWANFALLFLIVPLLFTAVALLMATLALFSKVRVGFQRFASQLLEQTYSPDGFCVGCRFDEKKISRPWKGFIYYSLWRAS